MLALASVMALVAGCASTEKAPRPNYQSEDFNSTDTHTRTFVASEAQTCEAARRALLSQGYLVNAGSTDAQVSGKKAFQPNPDVHLEIDFRVVCATDRGGRQDGKPRTIAFVSALQDRYSLKKVNNSASVGVSVIGSLSLPYSSTDDSLVKVASQTVTDEQFYDRFFKIVERYLVLDQPVPAPPVATPVPSPAYPSQLAPGAVPQAADVVTMTPLAPLPAAEPPAPPADKAPEKVAPASEPTRSVAGAVEPLGEPRTAPGGDVAPAK